MPAHSFIADAFGARLSIIAYLTLSIAMNNEALACSVEPEMLTLMQLHNQARLEGHHCSKQGMPAAKKLSWNCTLAEVARAHTLDMAEHKFLSHRGSDGISFDQRVTRAGFSWLAVAENVGRGYKSTPAAHSAWLAREEHCRNIMNHDYAYIGAAERDGYWTVVFAR